MVAFDAAVQGAHDSHGAHGIDQRAGDKALREGAASADFFAQKITEAVHRGINIQQFADDRADNQRQNGDQGIFAAHQTGDGNADGNQRQHGYNRGFHPVGHQLAAEHAGNGAHGDGRGIDKGSG